MKLISASDGSDEHPLCWRRPMTITTRFGRLMASPSFSRPIVTWCSGDLFRVNADGSVSVDAGLTSDAAYEDQAAFFPDGKQLVFVSIASSGRNGKNLWTLDIATKQREGVDIRARRRLLAGVVARWKM